MKSSNLDVDKVSDLGLEECIRMYNLEDNRKNSLESKASTLLTGSALLISILGIFITFSTALVHFNTYYWIYGILDIIIISFVGTCTMLLLKSIKIKNYNIPFRLDKANEIDFELRKSQDELKIDIFDRYVGTIVQNYSKNEKKAKLLGKAYILLILAVIALIFLLLSFIVLEFFMRG